MKEPNSKGGIPEFYNDDLVEISSKSQDFNK